MKERREGEEGGRGVGKYVLWAATEVMAEKGGARCWVFEWQMTFCFCERPVPARAPRTCVFSIYILLFG